MGEIPLGLLTYSAGFQLSHKALLLVYKCWIIIFGREWWWQGEQNGRCLCYDADVTFHLTHFDIWYSHCNLHLLKNFIMKNLDNKVEWWSLNFIPLISTNVSILVYPYHALPTFWFTLKQSQTYFKTSLSTFICISNKLKLLNIIIYKWRK